MSTTSLAFAPTLKNTGISPGRLGPYADFDRTDDEFDRAIGRFLTVKDQNLAISGTIPIESESTVLLFETSVRFFSWVVWMEKKKLSVHIIARLGQYILFHSR